MVIPHQGDIWWAEAEDKRRPVLVVTRSAAIPVLSWLVVAPITRSIRGIPTQIPLDERNGLREPCAASFDNLQPVRRSYLTERVGAVAIDQTNEICRALCALADC